MEPLLVYPFPVAADLSQGLDRAGFRYVGVSDEIEAERNEPEDGWGGAILMTDRSLEGAIKLAVVLRKRDFPLEPLLLVVRSEQLASLEQSRDLFDDVLFSPLNHRELEWRLKHQYWRLGRSNGPELVEYGELVLNVETYQAVIARRPLDLTYMEYELLRFLAQHPGKVFTRETLLNRVWGYEYYGGARTVDVHVRRLRAKLGEEHASLIQTVRSVGYRFGQSRWSM
ncbi:MAG: DNA-binding response regulator [Acidimicrobiales bacterium]